MILSPSTVLRAVAVVALGCGCARPALARQPVASRVLTPGVPAARELARGQSHTYEVALDTGQFTAVSVWSRAVLALSITDPAGRVMIEATVKHVSVVADATGRYVVQVRANGPAVGSEPYELTLEPPRPAGAQENARAAGDRALSEAMLLTPQRSAAADQQAKATLTAAIASFRQADYRWGEALALSRLGQLYQRGTTDMTLARTTLAEALTLARAIEDVPARRGVSPRAWHDLHRFTRPQARAGVLRTSARDLRVPRRSRRPGHCPHECCHRVERPAGVSDCGGCLRPGAAARLECWRPRAGRTHPQQPWRHAPAAWRRAAGLGALPESASPQPVHRQRSARVDGRQQHGDRLQAAGRLPPGARVLRAVACRCVRQLGNPSNEAQLLNNIGNIQKAEGRPEESLGPSTRRWRSSAGSGHRRARPWSLNNMGSAHFQLAQYRPHWISTCSPATCRKALGDRRGEASSLNYAGVAWHKLGEPSRALADLRESLAIRRQTTR